MGDLTKNLSRSEFACPCDYPECNRVPIDFDLPPVIQDCVTHFEFHYRNIWRDFKRIAVHINSGYRCEQHDRDIKGDDFDSDAKLSEHIFGGAADHWFEVVYKDGTRDRVPDDDVADYYELTYPGRYGIGRYVGWTHIDTARNNVARWDKR
jgi:hypothetical protein